jgi:hypothetical protein
MSGEKPTATLRVTRARQLQSSGVSYRILCDDLELGKLRSNSTAVFSVDPGQHIVQVLGRFPSYPQSNALDVNLVAEGVTHLGCRTVRSISRLARSGLSFGAGNPPMSILLSEWSVAEQQGPFHT